MDSEVSINDSGFTRPGLGGTVLCLHTASDQEEAKTVLVGSRDRFLVLCFKQEQGVGPAGQRQSREREQGEVLGLVCID